MLFHMKTTLHISDPVMRKLKAEAARRKTTMSSMVESALRAYLQAKPSSAKTRGIRLPVYSMGRPRVDISNRDRLYDVMDES